MAARPTVLEHFEELRFRIIRVAVVLFFLSVLAYPLSDDVIVFLKARLLGEYADSVVVLSPLEAVSVRVKASLLLAAVFSSPYITYHTLSFLLPALRKKEGALLIQTLACSMALFVLGCAFSLLFLLPVSYKMLLSIAEPFASPMLDLSVLADLTFSMTLLSGILFQWPLLAGLLSRMKVISPKQLSNKRRYAILASFTVAAIVTDPSLVTQVLLAVPMVLLYEAGIVAAKLAYKRR